MAVEQGVSHTTAVMDKLAFAFKKPLLIGETGWPSHGRQRFWSQTGLVNQARYLREFLNMAEQRGWQYNVIEAVDQPWKRGLEGTVGGYWGVFDTDLHAKFNFQGGVAERQDGWLPYALTALLALLGWFWAASKGLSSSARSLALLTAANLGLHGYLQTGYVLLAARDTLEWLSLGGLVVLGWGLVWMQLRRWLGQSGWDGVQQLALLLFAVALLVVSASLAVDGRYRDFPLLLVCLPLLVMSLAVLAADRPSQAQAANASLWVLAVCGLLATNLAIAVAMPETGNMTAWWWVATCGLAALVLPLKAWLKV